MHDVGFFCPALLAHKLLNKIILFETFCMLLYYFGRVKPHRFWYDMWKNSKKNFILDPRLPHGLNLVCSFCSRDFNDHPQILSFETFLFKLPRTRLKTNGSWGSKIKFFLDFFHISYQNLCGFTPPK